MIEVNLKDFEFEQTLLANVRLFDEILSQFGEPPLFENENFAPYLDFVITSRHVVLELISSKTSTLPVTFRLGAGSLRIDIDRMNETLEWSNEQIEAEKSSVVSLISNLLTGYVLIETRNASRIIRIFDADGVFIDSIYYNIFFPKFAGLSFIRPENYRRLYLPMFAKTK